jgi:hypothetical protein
MQFLQKVFTFRKKREGDDNQQFASCKDFLRAIDVSEEALEAMDASWFLANRTGKCFRAAQGIMDRVPCLRGESLQKIRKTITHGALLETETKWVDFIRVPLQHPVLPELEVRTRLIHDALGTALRADDRHTLSLVDVCVEPDGKGGAFAISVWENPRVPQAVDKKKENDVVVLSMEDWLQILEQEESETAQKKSIQTVVDALVELFSDLREAKITHGNLNLQNMLVFPKGDEWLWPRAQKEWKRNAQSGRLGSREKVVVPIRADPTFRIVIRDFFRSSAQLFFPEVDIMRMWSDLQVVGAGGSVRASELLRQQVQTRWHEFFDNADRANKLWTIVSESNPNMVFRELYQRYCHEAVGVECWDSTCLSPILLQEGRPIVTVVSDPETEDVAPLGTCVYRDTLVRELQVEPMLEGFDDIRYSPTLNRWLHVEIAQETLTNIESRILKLLPLWRDELEEETQDMPSVIATVYSLVDLREEDAPARVNARNLEKRRKLLWSTVGKNLDVVPSVGQVQEWMQVLQEEFVRPLQERSELYAIQCVPTAAPTTTQEQRKSKHPHMAQILLHEYVSPLNPVKGHLLHWDVGTGKTIGLLMIARAFWQFNQARNLREETRWRILWVSRKSLLGIPFDSTNVWALNYQPDLERTLQADELGYTKPTDMIEVYTLGQFANRMRGRGLMAGGSRTYRLWNRNKDPLWRTVVLFDEAHKIFTGELSAQEAQLKPEQLAALYKKTFHDSYRRSGNDSMRLMLSTATPSDPAQPLRTLKLLNMLKSPDDAIPDSLVTRDDALVEFRRQTVGLISYLFYHPQSEEMQRLFPRMKLHPPLVVPLQHRSIGVKRCVTDVKAKEKTIGDPTLLPVNLQVADGGKRSADSVLSCLTRAEMWDAANVGQHNGPYWGKTGIASFTQQMCVKYGEAERGQIPDELILSLLRNVDEVDDGAKHVVFSGADKGWGAKLIALAMRSVGYPEYVFDFGKRQFLEIPSKSKCVASAARSAHPGFLVLSDKVLLNGKFLGERSKPPDAVVKDALMKMLNARPQNIRGESGPRFIILDERQKEGISLFDIGHLHIVGTQADDPKQIIGRVRRLCGQIGIGQEHPVNLWMYVGDRPYQFVLDSATESQTELFSDLLSRVDADDDDSQGAAAKNGYTKREIFQRVTRMLQESAFDRHALAQFTTQT